MVLVIPLVILKYAFHYVLKVNTQLTIDNFVLTRIQSPPPKTIPNKDY